MRELLLDRVAAAASTAVVPGFHTLIACEITAGCIDGPGSRRGIRKLDEPQPPRVAGACRRLADEYIQALGG